MSQLPVVYAYRDGGVLLEGTRWEPRKVSCTQSADHIDAPGTDYVVKYRRRGRVGAAAVISEVVCHTLLRALRIRTLRAALVSVSSSLARSYAVEESVGFEIMPGLHFGTVHRPDFMPADPETWEPQFWEQLAEPKELIDIWAADCWLMNLDREVYGNLLLERGKQGKWHLIPADQSDCFLGAGALADGSCFARSRTHGAAAYLPLLELTLVNLGCAPLYEVVSRIRGATAAVVQAATNVPDEWWREASLSSQAVIDCLLERVDRIREIVELDKWEGVTHATQGGRLLDL